MTPTPYETTYTDGADAYAKRRKDMVDRQLRRRGITDRDVLKAMEQVPREQFVPVQSRHHAYCDGALAIGEDQTISQPWIVAFMTSLLELDGDDRVLEVGTGSGYGAAVLSRCAREVVTIERHESLATRARETLKHLGYTNVEVRTGDGSKGAPDRAPFDAISVTAAAEVPPPELMRQLGWHGALVVPIIGGENEYLTRFRDGNAEQFVGVRFVPLVESPDFSGENEQ
jgi:protein-L-isoaspartate(D-aspartate) O-methyltransferase